MLPSFRIQGFQAAARDHAEEGILIRLLVEGPDDQ